MDNEKDAVLDFLNDVGEKSDIFKEDVKEEVVEKEEEEKALPFHKDPKVQKYIAKEVARGLEAYKPSAEQQFKQEVKDINLPDSFVKLVGNDTPEKVQVLKDLSSYFGTLKGEARAEFLAEMQQEEAKAHAEDQAAVDELQAGFDDIEEEYGVDLDADKATRVAFSEYLRKVSPKNADGEVKAFADISATWEEFQEKNKRSASRAKQLASRGMARSGDTNNAPITGKSWKDVDRYFDSLSKKLN